METWQKQLINQLCNLLLAYSIFVLALACLNCYYIIFDWRVRCCGTMGMFGIAYALNMKNEIKKL